MRRMAMTCLLAGVATFGVSGSLLAQSPSPPEASSTPMEDAGPDPFPNAGEISEILGVDVEARGVEDGLSQLWEGSDIDWQALPSAQLAMYASPADADPETLTGIIIDIVRFESTDDATQHMADVAFGDDDVDPGFETELDVDFVATMSFASEDGFGGSVIMLSTGPDAVAVTVFASGVSEMEAASTAIVELVLDRLVADS